MNVEIKEINKISLKEDEILFIKLPKCSTKGHIEAAKVLAENLPEDWKGKVFIISGDIEFTKIMNDQPLITNISIVEEPDGKNS